MTTIDKSRPVLVTGASGYIASWIVKQLLDEGCTVHATVRDPSNASNLVAATHYGPGGSRTDSTK